MAEPEERLKELLQTGGTWTTVYVDGSKDREDPQRRDDTRRHSIRDRLGRAGASDAAVTAVNDALEAPTGLPSPLTRYLLVHDDELVFDETLPGEPASDEVLSIGALPVLVPYLQQRGTPVTHLLVEADDEGGTVTTRHTGDFGGEEAGAVTSRAADLGRSQDGAWNHSRYPHHVEDIERRTQDELAATVDRVVQRTGADLVVVAGSEKAREYLIPALGERTRELTATYPHESGADGADQSGLVAFVEEQLTKLSTDDTADVVQRLQTAAARGDGYGETGLGMTVEALRQAQVDTLLIDPSAFGDRTLLALDDSPWVATQEQDVAPATSLGEAPAADVLLRAATQTDAAVRFVGAHAIGGDPVAVLLRWPARATAEVGNGTGTQDAPASTHHRSSSH